MAGDIVTIHKFKQLPARPPAERLLPVEKWPARALLQRRAEPDPKFAETDRAWLSSLPGAKLPHRVRMNVKLRFFRVFKLIEAKAEAQPETLFRERPSLTRWKRRL